MQIIERIQYAYEELPAWLKPSIDLNNWNKHTCGFSNKSIIVSTTTSKNSGRGLPISVVYCLKGDSSFVTIRNKNTGEISNMSLVDLFEQLD